MKPDLIVYNQDRVYSVGVQIITDQFSLNDAHRNKASKYKVLRHHLEHLRPGGFHSTSLTVNWKVVCSSNSIKDLRAFGLLRLRDLKVLAMKVLLGGFVTHNVFQRMTVHKGLKKGDG